jgi:hypothetical protein
MARMLGGWMGQAAGGVLRHGGADKSNAMHGQAPSVLPMKFRVRVVAGKVKIEKQDAVSSRGRSQSQGDSGSGSLTEEEQADAYAARIRKALRSPQPVHACPLAILRTQPINFYLCRSPISDRRRDTCRPCKGPLPLARPSNCERCRRPRRG